MIYEAQIVALAFGAVFGIAFEINIEKQMGVPAEVPQQAGADAEDLFAGIGNLGAVNFKVGNLL
jgi:hypothetical protein